MGNPPDSGRNGERIEPWGRTIVMSHSRRTPTVVVLLHGLSASPRQFARFGEQLFERGANVVVPRLPRHGHADRMSRALMTLRADDLDRFRVNVLGHARELGDRIVVMGFSLGGLVACRVAQFEPVARVIAVAPFLGLAFSPGGADRLILRGALAMPNRMLWWHPLLRERHGPAHGYPRYSTHAVGQAFRLAEQLFDAASSQPPKAGSIALVSNASETTVSNAAIGRLAQTWQKHPGVAVERYRFTGLPPSHDIIEPLLESNLTPRVYPKLLELVDR